MDARVVDQVTLGDDWSATFAHLTPPLVDEWLPGLLLRCDEVNGWIAGTTAGHCTDNPIRNRPSELILGSGLRLAALATALALRLDDVVRTTFVPELTRLFAEAPARSLDLGQAPRVRVCPRCVREGLSLRKFLAWPYITCCPLHEIAFPYRCACGALLLLYPRGSVRRTMSRQRITAPFTCYQCQRPWGDLPCAPGAPSALASDSLHVAYFRLFLGSPSSDLYAKARYALRARAQGWEEQDIISGACAVSDLDADDGAVGGSVPMLPTAVAPLIHRLVVMRVSPTCVEHAPIRPGVIVRRPAARPYTERHSAHTPTAATAPNHPGVATAPNHPGVA